jgi:hypothetical protein
MALAGSGKVTAEIRSLNVALQFGHSFTWQHRRAAMAKSAKSTVKPFLVLIAASALTWAAFMAIHGLS